MGILVGLVVAVAVVLSLVVVMDQRAKRRRRALDRDDLPITKQLIENQRSARLANSIYGVINNRPDISDGRPKR